ncbi:hypothetical protein HYE61_03975 [Aggregatibacter actinomycetemcomitans]|nr:hypothetical protein [Aggregatibacter actinomycetemcomitans]
MASELQFFLSEIYANESGRTLAKVLKHFIDAGCNGLTKRDLLFHSDRGAGIVVWHLDNVRRMLV